EEFAGWRTQASQRHVFFGKEIDSLAFNIKRLVDAIAEGTDTPAMPQRLMGLEGKKSQMEAELAAEPTVPIIDLHPDLPRIYRNKVAHLQEALGADATDGS